MSVAAREIKRAVGLLASLEATCPCICPSMRHICACPGCIDTRSWTAPAKTTSTHIRTATSPSPYVLLLCRKYM